MKIRRGCAASSWSLRRRCCTKTRNRPRSVGVLELEDLLEELLAGDELAAVREQHLEQAELGGRQRDRLARPRDLPPREVDHQVAVANHDAAPCVAGPARRRCARERARSSDGSNGFTM